MMLPAIELSTALGVLRHCRASTPNPPAGTRHLLQGRLTGRIDHGGMSGGITMAGRIDGSATGLAIFPTSVAEL
jgi:hypothetical protein